MRLISADDLLRVAAGELPDREDARPGYEAALDAALRDVEGRLFRSFAVARWEAFQRPTTLARPVGSARVRSAAYAEAWPLVEVVTEGVVLARIEAANPDPEARRLLVSEDDGSGDGSAWPQDPDGGLGLIEYYAGYRPTDAALNVQEGDDEAAILVKLKALGDPSGLGDLSVLPAPIPADVVDAVCELALARMNVRRAGTVGLAEKSERIDGNRENVVRTFATADPLGAAMGPEGRLARYRSLL
jgi:hypothetical protein